MDESQTLNDFIFDHCNKSMDNALSAERHPLWKRSCPEPRWNGSNWFILMLAYNFFRIIRHSKVIKYTSYIAS